MQKFTREEAMRADKGVIDTAYGVLMATPRTASIDNRSNPVYLRHLDRKERADETGNKLIDDEVGAVAEASREWHRK